MRLRLFHEAYVSLHDHSPGFRVSMRARSVRLRAHLVSQDAMWPGDLVASVASAEKLTTQTHNKAGRILMTMARSTDDKTMGLQSCVCTKLHVDFGDEILDAPARPAPDQFAPCVWSLCVRPRGGMCEGFSHFIQIDETEQAEAFTAQPTGSFAS